jgi:hypothetical protein
MICNLSNKSHRLQTYFPELELRLNNLQSWERGGEFLYPEGRSSYPSHVYGEVVSQLGMMEKMLQFLYGEEDSQALV